MRTFLFLQYRGLHAIDGLGQTTALILAKHVTERGHFVDEVLLDGALFGGCQFGTVALRLFHLTPHLYAGVPDETDIVEVGQQLGLHNFVFLCQFVKLHYRR